MIVLDESRDDIGLGDVDNWDMVDEFVSGKQLMVSLVGLPVTTTEILELKKSFI
jgi:hypothetical protein